MINAVGREIPEKIGSYTVKPFAGTQESIEFDAPVVSKRMPNKRPQGENKMLPDLKSAIVATGLKDGMTISFHHSFREGDKIIGQVLTAIRELGIKGLRFAPSAVVNIKNPSIVDFVKDGTINRIQASGIRGELGDAVVNGEVELAEPVILRPHGSRPHAIPGDRVIEQGMFVTMDFGCKVDGYCSDMTRTVAIGQPDEEMERVYETVLAAQKAGINAARAGVTGREIDAAARRVIEEAGYGEYFSHSFGHSLGIDIHEAPNASPKEQKEMPVGAVISAEPGIYIPGKFGVRIEDVLILKEGGCEDITRSPRNLIIL
jgi:hypothetical protein